MSEIDIDQLHRDRAALVSALAGAGAVFKPDGKTCRCPFHDDSNPSAGVYEKDGVWRFKCHGCGINEDVIGVMAKIKGRDSSAELREMGGGRQEEAPKPTRIFPTVEAVIESIASYHNVEDHYRYTNPDSGLVEMVTIRCIANTGKKSFLVASPKDGGFVLKSPPKPWPILNRKAIAEGSTVVVCEGEKCVKEFWKAGFVATTSPCGAENFDSADWTPLAGKTVYLWRDFDSQGDKYIKGVLAQLQRLNPPATILMLDVSEFSLPEGSDVVDYLEYYGGATKETRHQAIKSALSLAEGCGPSALVRRMINDTISGKRYAVAWPWPKLDDLTNALLPGTATAICGDPAASKSFMLLQAMGYWHRSDVMTATYQLESDEEGSHLMRSLVQHTGHVQLLNWKWVRDNGEEARRIEDENREFLDSFGRRLWIPPSLPPSLMELIDWVRDRAKEGCRVIGIDPITAADTSKQRWEDDRQFVLQTQTIMRDYRSSLVLVTHPKLSAKNGTLADVAGGAAYTRFTQTVMWIKGHEPPKEVVVSDSFGGEVDHCVNRTIRITKARLGRGTGFELAYKFGNGMIFEELGAIVKKSKSRDDEP